MEEQQLAVVTPRNDLCRWTVGVAVRVLLTPESTEICGLLSAAPATRIDCPAAVFELRLRASVWREGRRRRSWTNNGRLPGGAGAQVGQPSAQRAIRARTRCVDSVPGDPDTQRIYIHSSSVPCRATCSSSSILGSQGQGQHHPLPSPFTSCLNSETPFDPAIFRVMN
jgi:hypothetical protein